MQGSAADVAMCAMLELDRNNQLKELGWKLLLQVLLVSPFTPPFPLSSCRPFPICLHLPYYHRSPTSDMLKEDKILSLSSVCAPV